MEQQRPDIEQAMSRMPSRLGAKKEIRKLPELLWEHEQVAAMVAGAYGKGVGLLVLTDRRILFTFEGVVSSSSEDFPFAKTSSIQWTSGMLLGSIIIFASGNKAEIKNCDKTNGKLFVDLARDRLAGYAQNTASPMYYGPPQQYPTPQHYPTPQQYQHPAPQQYQPPAPQQYQHPAPQPSPTPQPQQVPSTRHAMPPKLTKTQTPTVATTPAPQTQDPMSSLRQLAELHQAGVLTDQEFTQKKAEILARL